MELALILYALLGLSVCAKLPDTNSVNRVNLTEYQKELLNRTNSIVADKLASLTTYFEYFKVLITEKHRFSVQMVNLTIEQIGQLEPTIGKEAECLSHKIQFQNQLRLFMAASANNGFEQRLPTISRKIESSMENFKKRNTLTASDSDKIPRNPADGQDFLYEKLYDLKAQILRDLTNITFEYFYQGKAELDLFDYIMIETMKQINTVCGTTEPGDQITDEIPEQLQRLIVEGPDVLLVQDNKTGGPMREEHEGSIDFKIRKLSEQLVNFVLEPPCNPPNVANTSWGNNQTQVMLKKQFITQLHDGCLQAFFKAKEQYDQMTFLEQFRAPIGGSRDGFNKVIAEWDYRNSVPVSLEQNRYKLEYIDCMNMAAPFIIFVFAPDIEMSFLGSCGDAQN